MSRRLRRQVSTIVQILQAVGKQRGEAWQRTLLFQTPPERTDDPCPHQIAIRFHCKTQNVPSSSLIALRLNRSICLSSPETFTRTRLLQQPFCKHTTVPLLSQLDCGLLCLLSLLAQPQRSPNDNLKSRATSDKVAATTLAQPPVMANKSVHANPWKVQC